MKVSNFIHNLTLAIKKFDFDFDCVSNGQLKSKEWAVNIMKAVQEKENINYGIIFSLCSWYSILPAFLYIKNIKFESIRAFDIDLSCKKIADRINQNLLQDGWRFQAVTEDIFKINYNKPVYKLWSYLRCKWFEVEGDPPDTIINTSCEHLDPSWFNLIPDNKFIILQSNDFLEGKDHTNCINSLEEFINMFPIKTIYYQGEIKLQNYTRYMLIGVK